MVRAPLLAVLALALGGAALFYGALGLRRGQRLLALVLACGAVLLTPLLISPDRPCGRVLASVFAVALGVKLYDVHVGVERGFRPDAWSFLAFLPNLAAVVLRKLDREPRPSRRENVARLARQTPVFLAGAAALIGVFQVDWRRWPFAVEHCAKVVAFLLMLVPGTMVATTVLDWSEARRATRWTIRSLRARPRTSGSGGTGRPNSSCTKMCSSPSAACGRRCARPWRRSS
jgi:MFS family permease